MQNSLMYKDILTLIFGNKQNADYFKKYYGDSRNYQIMFRDYIAQTPDSNLSKKELEIKNKKREVFKQNKILNQSRGTRGNLKSLPTRMINPSFK